MTNDYLLDVLMRIVWLTDLHLNFVDAPLAAQLLQQVAQLEPDAVLISGDIAEAHDVVSYLQQIDDQLQRPVYFVLGNHDYYFGSIREVRQKVISLCADHPRLHYLSAAGHFALSSRLAVVGHDGWADARIGDYQRSLVMMNDYRLIRELAGANKQTRLPLLQALGDEAADHVRQVLPEALAEFPEVFLVTHVPPLREACWHEGKISDDEWAPHFTCKAMGDAILEIMPRYPNRQLTVLCGHTHGSGQSRPLPNVLILTGGATYGSPAVTKIFELE